LSNGNERAAALAALSKDQMKRLAAYAKILSPGTGDEGGDLLHDAFARWLRSEKPVEGPAQTYEFLWRAIRSVRFNALRHQKVVRRYEGVRAVAAPDDEEDPLDQAVDATASADRRLIAQQLYDLCQDDEIKLLVMTRLDNATPAEIQAELGWDEKKYKAVQKKKARLVIRLTLEGTLK
jgi:DNA-directed RNA polymerase specialized sigma24 family protein